MAQARVESCGKTVELSYLDEGSGEPVVLIHGFASTKEVNWIQPGWVKALTSAGLRVVAPDSRGHGASTKFYERADYKLECMAGDVLALLDFLGIGNVDLIGYSLGARICVAMALAAPQRVRRVVLSGSGSNMIEQSDWTPVRDALLADDPGQISDPRAVGFRAFADRTRSDRRALAACLAGVAETFSPKQLAGVSAPVLVAVGSDDETAGSGEQLAALLPDARHYVIEGRDHMRAVGDRGHIAAAIDFLRGSAPGLRPPVS